MSSFFNKNCLGALLLIVSGCESNINNKYQYIVPCDNKSCLNNSLIKKASYKKIDYSNYIYKNINNNINNNDGNYIHVKNLYDKMSQHENILIIDDISEVDMVLNFLYKDLNQLISIYNFSNYSSELENINLYRSDNAFLAREMKFLNILRTENNRQYIKLESIKEIDKSEYDSYKNALKEQYYQINENINNIQSVVLNNIENVRGLIKFFNYTREKYEKKL
ncbi:TPA: hypothetical protein ACX6QK_001262 [Photobacterium damselae]